MHRKELVSGNNFPTDIYFDFSELTIFTVCERLAEYVPSFSKMLFKQYLRELGVSYEKMPHNSLIHNDLYVDQFHFSQKTTLLDWNFLSRSSPVVDLASILRNDYDTRNGNFNKVAFLKAYMHHSASVFELKDLET
jgi:thiamine kinase-like enzyme